MTATATFASPPSSARYQGLIDTIDKSLQESRKAFDTEAAVKECYGNDSALFGDENGPNKRLPTVIDGTVDRVNDRVKDYMMELFQREKVHEKLIKVDELIETFDRAETEAIEADAKDAESAMAASSDAKLPQGVSPSDAISYHAFCIIQQEKEALLAQVEGVESEINNIEKQIAQGEAFVNDRMKKIQQAGKELESDADRCSMAS